MSKKIKDQCKCGHSNAHHQFIEFEGKFVSYGKCFYSKDLRKHLSCKCRKFELRK